MDEILNAGDNVDYQEDFGFTGSYYKISHTVIDDYTRKKFLNMQLENLRPIRNIQKNYKQTDEIYQEVLIDDKESDERDQIIGFDEEKMIENIEVLKLQKLSSHKIYIYLEKESDEINPMDMSDNKKYDEREQISKNDEVKVSDVIENLKLVKLSLHKIQTMLRKNLI